ncbi:glycosyltransferase [bacterium]|nr:glycosyltransferase [bacterium]
MEMHDLANDVPAVQSLERPLRICDMVQAYADGSGGVKTYLDQKRRFLMEETECEHVLIIPGESDRCLREGRAITYEVESPVVRGAGAYRFIGRVDKLLRILGDEALDVVEVGDPWLMPWVARYHRLRRKTPMVGFYHTDIARAYGRPYATRVLGSGVGRAAESLMDHYARAVYSACDAVVTASPDISLRLSRWPIPWLEEIPLGVDLERFHPARRDRALWASLGVDARALVLLYVGRLDGEKRCLELVEAFASARLDRPAALVMVGAGPLRQAILERGNPRVHVLDYVGDRDRLAQLFASSDLYVTAGPHETFALSVVEAQASGLGVVGVAAGALRDRVPLGAGLLAEPESIGSLARALEEALRRDLLAMGRAGRAAVEARYSWRSTGERLLRLYRGLASRNAA